MALTVSTHYAIPSLIGRGLTEASAREALDMARILGEYPAQIGANRVIPISYAGSGKFTLGAVR